MHERSSMLGTCNKQTRNKKQNVTVETASKPAKLMKRGPKLQYHTYNPTPVEIRAMMASAIMKIPTYRLGEQIPWNKTVYHAYNNRHGRYRPPTLSKIMAKWVTWSDPPARMVTISLVE